MQEGGTIVASLDATIASHSLVRKMATLYYTASMEVEVLKVVIYKRQLQSSNYSNQGKKRG